MKAEEIAEMMKSQRTTMIDQPATERNDEKGITVLECAVILVLVALAIASFNAGFSATLSSLFTRVITALG